MVNYAKLGWKSMKMNPVRTGLTAAGMAVAVFVFCFFQSVKGSMADVVAEAGKQNNLVVMEKNKW